jgi:ferredoxin
MNIQSLRLVCFSPTGTTKAILRGIARGFNPTTMEIIDITTPEARNQTLKPLGNELLVVGLPVYMGRVPALITDWLHTISAQNAPTVCVVVYGNRAYEDALLELTDILILCGCIPIAGAAFIGEHSFSGNEFHTAKGRPDAIDLHQAELFGQKIQQMLNSIPSIADISGVEMPGCKPYRWNGKLWDVDFIKVSDACTQCGICAEGCPVGAIDLGNSSMIDHKKCITCCACIKNCPQNAKTMKTGLVKDAAIRLSNLYQKRKEPEFFLDSE